MSKSNLILKNYIDKLPKNLFTYAFKEENIRREFKNKISLKGIKIKGFLENINIEYKNINNIINEVERNKEYINFITFVFLIADFNLYELKSYFSLDKKRLIKALTYKLNKLEQKENKEQLLNYLKITSKNIKNYKKENLIFDDSFRNFYKCEKIQLVRKKYKHPGLLQSFEKATGFNIN